MDKSLLLAQSLTALRKKVEELSSTVVLQGKNGEQGAKGDKGEKGEKGPKGDKGADGKDGYNGSDGKDGSEGKDGVSIVDVYWAADDSLVCVLSDGREIDTGPFLGAGTGNTTNVSNTWAGYNTEELKKTFVSHAFETVNKNLASFNGGLGYTGSNLTTITYANGVLKTLAYTAGGDLLSVTLSGILPEGVKLTKTFSYTSGELTSFNYS